MTFEDLDIKLQRMFKASDFKCVSEFNNEASKILLFEGRKKDNWLIRAEFGQKENIKI